jgi:hypothetical protein
VTLPISKPMILMTITSVTTTRRRRATARTSSTDATNREQSTTRQRGGHLASCYVQLYVYRGCLQSVDFVVVVLFWVFFSPDRSSQK